MTSVDLNADLGESFGSWVLGDDLAMLDVVTSANVACGFHAGDPLTLHRTVAAAGRRGVAIGAHVGYRDLAGFGRRFIDMESADLTAEIIYQMGALDGLARSVGQRVRYVKPHGALYNTIISHTEQAAAVVAAVTSYDAALPVVGMSGSEFLRLAAQAGLRTVNEAFADRAYTAEGTLVPRRDPGAVLLEPVEIAARIVGLVTTGQLRAITGELLAVEVDSICVHGDTPGAVAIAKHVRSALKAAGVRLRAVAG
ncbi:MAG: LamB/YcsF family protein [Actinomycetota bacterium]|nr:LamB/YcsF family protein [Actinomycetota bacterium]